MEYRVNRRTGDRISALGMGTSAIASAGEAEGIETLRLAVENGINYFDLATAESVNFTTFGKALADVRDKVLYQVHFGAVYGEGRSYSWTTDLDTVRRSVDWQLKELKTDYIDYGFIHCLDEAADWEKYRKNGVLDYLLEQKKAGVVRHIGLSSHTPELVHQVLDTGLVDMLMFSINPAYDYQHGEYASGSAAQRSALYRRCQAEGVGVSVMKPYSGGQLLDAKTSPFGVALTDYQCLQYALDRPGVLTVLPGIRGKADLQRLLGFFDAPEAKRDYAAISSLTPGRWRGRACTATTASPVPPGWTSGSSTSIMIWPRPGTPWRRTTTAIWRYRPTPASPAATATAAAPSMWTRRPGWWRSTGTSRNIESDPAIGEKTCCGGEHKAPRRGFFVGFCSCYSQPGGASSSGTVGSVSVPPPTSALPPVSVLPSVPSPPSEGGRTGSSPPPGSVSAPPSVPPLGGMPASGRPAVPTRMIWLRLL